MNQEHQVLEELGMLHTKNLADKWIDDFIDQHVSDKDFGEYCKYAMSLMGYRERTWLTYNGARLVKRNHEDFRLIALAAEFGIGASLTNDDVADEAKIRWGKPTLFRKLGPVVAMHVSQALQGLSQLASSAFFRNAVVDLNLDPGDVYDALNNVEGYNVDVYEWQFINSKECDVPVTELGIVKESAWRRTGRLLAGSLSGPVIAVPGPPELKQEINRLGKGIGVMLQFRDDILDFVGEPDSIGKPVGRDLASQEGNLVSAFLHSAHPDKAELKAAIQAAYDVLLEEASQAMESIEDIRQLADPDLETEVLDDLSKLIGVYVDLPIELE